MTMEFLNGLTFDVMNRITGVVVLVAVSLAVITDKLTWHSRLDNERARGDRWEAIAIESLKEGAKAGVKAAEIAAVVVAALPDPSRKKDEEESS